MERLHNGDQLIRQRLPSGSSCRWGVARGEAAGLVVLTVLNKLTEQALFLIISTCYEDGGEKPGRRGARHCSKVRCETAIR